MKPKRLQEKKEKRNEERKKKKVMNKYLKLQGENQRL